MEKTADLLENIVVKNMLNMRSTMTEILSADSIKNSGDKLKQYQEFFCNGLLQFEKAIRGAAEVLGDDLESGGSTCIVSTGRGEILKTCSGKLQSFYQNFRREMMNTLIYLHDSLKAIPLDNLFSSLSNNSSIHVLWMKVFNAIVLRRMSNLKEVDKTNKYLKYANRMERTSIVKVVYKTMKEQERNCVASDHDLSLLTLSTKDGWLERLRMIDYWRSHDMTTNLLVCNVWLTLVKRHQQLSYTSVRSLLDQSKDSHPIIATMDRLVALCGHEYDVIRTKAENHFKVISSRYGKRLICIARDMMGVLSTQSSAYPTAIGASTIVGMNKIVKRIAADWELTEMFLTTVLNSQTLIGNIPEQDKREMLMSKISEAFVRYTGIWHSVHLPTGKSSSVLVNNVMKTLGVKVDGANTSQDVVEATGIRFQSIAAFILLHLIGNKHVPLTESFWKWSVETLSNANGQPTQALALTALIRLSANYAANSETSPLDRQFLLDTFSIASEDRWQAIIRGISQSRPKQSDDGSSAQWSAGVDHILRCAGFFRIVFERSITAIRGDGGAFSNSFRKEAAGLFLSLCNANIILTDASKESIRIVNVLLSSASHIPSSGDAESRTNNSVRAEIFSALLRSYLSRKTISEELELIFTKYLADNLEKLSYDYAKDWAEAIYFACTGLPNAADGKINFISKYLLDALQQVLAIKGDDLGLNEDGFAREAKQVMLASAIVQADLVACQEYFDDHRIDESVSLVTQTALQIVESPKISLVSSYRSSRLEMASLLRVSVDLTFEQKDHLATIRRSLLERFNTLIMKADTVEAGESQLIESNKDSADKQQVKDLNNCVEFACYWLKFLVRSYPIQEYANYLPDLLLIAIRGSGNGDIEVAKLSHESVLVAASSFLCPQQVIGNDLVSDASTMKSLLSLLKTSLCDASWHVRETILIATTLIMINNWWLMNDESRKCCRDIFVIGTEDVKPEVQNLAKAGMVSYLSTKSYSELSKVAAAYIKNSETFSQRYLSFMYILFA